MAHTPRRILHIAKLDPRAPGGIERFAHDLMNAQASHGHAVHVVACAAPPSGDASAAQYGITLAPTWFTLFHLPVAPSFPSAIRRAIRDFSPDVVHLHWPNPLATQFLGALSPQTQLVIQWQADIEATHAPLAVHLAYALGVRRAESRLLTRADAVLATSDAYAAASEPLRQLPTQKLHIVPLALGTLPAADGAMTWPFATNTRALFIGRLVPYKALGVLIDAIATAPDASLVVIGNGPMRARWATLAAQSPARDRIHFAGSVGEAEKRRWLEAADVLCLPSDSRLESFGMVLLEAAAAGKPVIAAEIPGSGVGYVARELAGGLSFPAGDASALAALLRDRAFATVRPKTPPTIDAVARRIESIYERAGTVR